MHNVLLASGTRHDADHPFTAGPVLITGATGKTGRRVARRLAERGLALRAGSRSGDPVFDWDDPGTWEPALQGAGLVYLTYAPDLAVPGAVDAVRTFVDLAAASGTRRIVLLSGRGEEEAQRAERVVQGSGLAWTIVRCSWFAQNFSENYLVDGIIGGEIALPAGDVCEPFVDAEDIADVVTAALTEPRLLTFTEAVAEIAEATGREIGYRQGDPGGVRGWPRRGWGAGGHRLAPELPVHDGAGRAQCQTGGWGAAGAGPGAARLLRLRAGGRRGRGLGQVGISSCVR
jgi:uncharacterized protein YbjT (DUF2867 family)